MRDLVDDPQWQERELGIKQMTLAQPKLLVSISNKDMGDEDSDDDQNSTAKKEKLQKNQKQK